MNARELQNRSRARRARAALIAHQTKEFSGNDAQARVELRVDPAAVLRYLLADLRHWANAKGINFAEQEQKAHDLYTDELTGTTLRVKQRRCNCQECQDCRAAGGAV